MSFDITKKVIKITRGDSGQFRFTAKDKATGEPYDYSNDLAEFTVKKNTRTKTVIFKKRIIGTVVTIEPADTKDLPYGTYKYDIQLITPDEDVYTVIDPHDFIVTDEVNENTKYTEQEVEGDVGT